MVQDGSSTPASHVQMGFKLVGTFSLDCADSLASDKSRLHLPFAAKRIVGLGEVAHASGDLHNLAGDLILKMAAVSVVDILFEAPKDAMEPIQLKMATGSEITIEDLSALYQVWRTPQMLNIFNRLSELNRSKPNSISISGIDVRLPISDFKKVLSTIPKPQQDEELGKFFEDPSRLRAFEIEMATGKVGPDHLKKLAKIEVAISKARGPTVKLDDPAFEDSIYRLKLWLATYRKFGEDVPAGFNQRDSSMFELTRKQIGLAKGRVIVWAHLGHLLYDSRTVKTPATYLNKSQVLGSRLKRQYGADFQTVALLAKIVNLKDAAGKVHRFQADPESVESLLSPLDKSVRLYQFNSENLGRGNRIKIARSSTGNLESKGGYPEMEISDQQFDYAAIIQESFD